ncbi:hypothetical protein AB0B66_34125 [Catellatospora sp. NPDC049111]|uniref:hypothetical protein n=1 Tax=Catellatospora sp. NPDC049111 TaxID=3155271 RepID=UPI0033C1DF89
MMTDPELSAAFRRNLIGIGGLLVVSTVGLYLLRLPTMVFLAMETTLLAVFAWRLWGRGEPDSARVNIAILVGGYGHEIVRLLAGDRHLRDRWRQAGVQVDQLIVAPAGRVAAAMEALVRADPPRIGAPARLGTAAACAAATMLVLAGDRPRLSSILVPSAVSCVALVYLVYTERYNRRQRAAWWAYLNADPARRVAGEMTALLAPVARAKQAAMVEALNGLSGVGRPLRLRTVTTTLTRLAPYAVGGGLAAMWLMMLLR